MNQDTMNSKSQKASLFSGSEVLVSSLTDAKLLLQRYMLPSGAAARRQLVDYITDPANCVFSQCDTYHNFIMDLFRAGDYFLALKVCNFALAMAPYNRDILGNALRACAHSSQFALGDTYLARAMELPRELWSYRMFLYAIDFLKIKLDAFPMKTDIFNQAMELIQEYIRIFPYDEHGYNQHAELLIQMNRRDEAIRVLRQYIFATDPSRPGETAAPALVTAQCCVTLLNLLDDSTDYTFICNVCDVGMRNTTQEQPSSSIGFFMYRKALALDAQAHANAANNSNRQFMEADVLQALRFYQSAYDLLQDRSYHSTIENRYAILRPHVKPENFQPLVRRKLYVDEIPATGEDNG